MDDGCDEWALGAEISSPEKGARFAPSALGALGHTRPATPPLLEIEEFGVNPGNLRMLVRPPHRSTGVATSIRAHTAVAEPGRRGAHRRDEAAWAPALVVALHGCLQTPASYDEGSGWSALADRFGFALLMPGQRPSNNPNRCFNWYAPEHTCRDRGEAGSIRQMIDYMVEGYDLDRTRVYVVGLSAGGAMAANLLAVYPEVFAGGATIAGLPFGAAGSLSEAMDGMARGRTKPALDLGDDVRAATSHDGPWPRISIWHGAADTVVHPVNATSLTDQWCELHGLRGQPHEESVGAHRRRVWKTASGREMVEVYDIAGMAHGVPLAGGGQSPACGCVGSFHLDAGICSTHRIASFWGLCGAIEP